VLRRLAATAVNTNELVHIRLGFLRVPWGAVGQQLEADLPKKKWPSARCGGREGEGERKRENKRERERER
jgi:hypothetical protein